MPSASSLACVPLPPTLARDVKTFLALPGRCAFLQDRHVHVLSGVLLELNMVPVPCANALLVLAMLALVMRMQATHSSMVRKQC